MRSVARIFADPTRRFGTSAVCSSSAVSFKAKNEPILSYERLTKERKQLEVKLNEYQNKVHDIPVVVGDEEIRKGDAKFQVKPYDHKSNLAQYYVADAKTLQHAIDVSQKVRHAWDSTPLEKRSEIFLKAADLISGKYRMDLMAAVMMGQGKTIFQAEIDICELADFYRFHVEFAQDALKWQPISPKGYTNRLLLRGNEGFWAAIAPFNFLAISGNIAGTPAFMGNVVLWKPSHAAVLSSYIVFKLLREAGVPPGVLNFVPSTGSVFGSTITQSPHLAGINFTGSAEVFQTLWKAVGNNIALYKTFPRLIGECGGKNYHLIHSSADIENAVNGTIRSAFEYSGQKCSACSRLYVPESRWNDFKEGLLKAHKNIKLGSPLEASSFMSAIIDKAAYASIKAYVDYAKASKVVKIIAGGKCDDSKGYFIEPTIIETSDPKDKLMQEEIFGPILTVYVYKDNKYSETLNLINTSTQYALTGAVFAKDQKALQEAADVLRHAQGNMYVNDKSTGAVVSQQPFGGARLSGTNDKAGGPHYILRFTSPLAIKTSTVPTTDWQYPYMKS